MDRFFAELDKAFTESVEVNGGTILRPDQPVLLDPLAEAVIDGTEVEQALIDDYGPGMALVHAGFIEVRTVVDFEWSGGGPMSSDVQIDLMTRGDKAYVCLGPDGDMDWAWMAIAFLGAGPRSTVLEGFLTDYLSTNGEGYGAGIFGGLPTEIRSVPELITRAGVRSAIGAWLDHAEQEYGSPWAESFGTVGVAADEADGSPEQDLLDLYIEQTWAPLG